MLHVLFTMWQVSPVWVVGLFAMIVAACVMIPALVIAYIPSKASNAPIDDYAYSVRGTDTAIEFPTLIDTKAEWSYQPEGN